MFIFCLEPTVREQLYENDFCHCYGTFFESIIHSDTTWSSHVQSSFARHFDNDTLQLMRFYGHGSSCEVIFS